MNHYDVFNGDADGICALQQFRLAFPAASTLITGVKRDISLLKRVKAVPGDEVNVFDISLDKNREPLEALLEQGITVRYFDHHYAGEAVPRHQSLDLNLNLTADTCTSLIVDRYLNGRFRAWAVVGAFGDNFDDSARKASTPLQLKNDQLDLLRELGICINYNGYGPAVEDLFYPPAELFKRIQPFADPLTFIAEDEEVLRTLRAGSQADIAKARAIKPEVVNAKHAVFIFPAEPWARRVSGVYSNDLATANPDRAHALLTQLPGGGFVVSVRAPLNNKTGADELCREFATGGGRKAAAGINNLPDDQLQLFIDRFTARYC
ncbi:MAG: acetyltransferase [Gammaproteobacteria bacterium]|nr:acetyltransferase [Gammaproteobacteria bacterium]